jgi:outer membrane immunogenic protein
MKKLAIAVAVTALIGIPAFAADLGRPVYKAPPPAPAPVPVYSWAGWYVGVNAGGAWGNFDPSSFMPFCIGATCVIAPDVNIYNSTVSSQSIKPSGFTGGFQAGYNWQWNNIVAGVEGDIEAFDLKGSSTVTGCFLPAPCGIPFTASSSASTTWLATTRGRLGFANNNWLFYGTGGAAFTTLKGNFGITDALGHFESASVSATKTGFTAGGGVEVGLWQQWSIRAEYLYVGFGRVSTTGLFLGGPGGVGPAIAQQTINHSIDLKANIVRVGLNYQFH